MFYLDISLDGANWILSLPVTELPASIFKPITHNDGEFFSLSQGWIPCKYRIRG